MFQSISNARVLVCVPQPKKILKIPEEILRNPSKYYFELYRYIYERRKENITEWEERGEGETEGRCIQGYFTFRRSKRAKLSTAMCRARHRSYTFSTNICVEHVKCRTFRSEHRTVFDVLGTYTCAESACILTCSANSAG